MGVDGAGDGNAGKDSGAKGDGEGFVCVECDANADENRAGEGAVDGVRAWGGDRNGEGKGDGLRIGDSEGERRRGGDGCDKGRDGFGDGDGDAMGGGAAERRGAGVGIGDGDRDGDVLRNGEIGDGYGS